MTVLEMSRTPDRGSPCRKAALDIADSILNESLRQYCIEQLRSADTPEEESAAVALVFELADAVSLFFRDVSERRRLEQQQLLYLAQHDILTGLLNRTVLYEHLEQALTTSSCKKQVALLFLDLDEFQSVNDSLGHLAGDQVLVAAADRLKDQVCSSDALARFGGDKFAIVAQVSGAGQAEALAGRIGAALNEPYRVQGREVTTGVSIGIVIVSEPGARAEDVIRDADIALYRAKGEGRGVYRLFEPAMGRGIREREELKQDLRGAAARGELHVVYQPVIDFKTSRVSGFEALLRWDHPTKGPVPPATFIPLAEESGAILEIGEWVLATACRDAASWPAHVSIAVNLSPVQFRSCALVETVSQCLSAAGVAPKRLHLEITETVLLARSQRNIEILHDLRRLGCCIAMDDFGTGYSSLSYLRSFPIDNLKVDRSFVSDISGEDGLRERPEALVQGIVDLSHSLGVTVTAEGVETEAQAAALRAMGCNLGQGYLFSHPVPKREADKIVSHLSNAEGQIVPFPPRPFSD